MLERNAFWVRRRMMDLAYIVSPSYSGSTLLTFLMASHPEIATIGELKGSAMGDIESYQCSCGSRIIDCEFWQQVTAGLAVKNVDFDLSNFRMRVEPNSRFAKRLVGGSIQEPAVEQIRRVLRKLYRPATTELSGAVGRNLAFMETATCLTNSKYFLDGSKDPARCLRFLEDERFNTKVIRINRDGRGISRSMMKNDAIDIRSAVAGWIDIVDEIDRLMPYIPDGQCLTVSYEALCDNPDDTLISIWDFLNLPHVNVADRIDLSRKHIIGNRMRLSGNTRIKLDERWKRELSHSDLALFEKYGGKLNRTMGYL
jgi:hypothetical protein